VIAVSALPGAVRKAPSGPRVMSGLSLGSCETTSTPSLVMPMSSSSVATPVRRAFSKAGSVFSGERPRAPRWPCRSKAAALAPARTKARQATPVRRMVERANGGMVFPVVFLPRTGQEESDECNKPIICQFEADEHEQGVDEAVEGRRVDAPHQPHAGHGRTDGDG